MLHFRQCVRCKRPPGYYYTVWCFDAKGSNLWREFLWLPLPLKFSRNISRFQRKKNYNYELYSRQWAKQEVKSGQYYFPTTQCRIVQDRISTSPDLNPIVNMLIFVSGDLHAKCERKIIFHRTDKTGMKNTILNPCSIKKKKMWWNSIDNRMQFRMEIQRKRIRPTLISATHWVLLKWNSAQYNCAMHLLRNVNSHRLTPQFTISFCLILFQIRVLQKFLKSLE